MQSDSKFPRGPVRLDSLSAALKHRLENEVEVLGLLVGAIGKGQALPELWEQLHEAARRDDRMAELAFAYERLLQDKRLKALNPSLQAEVLMHAAAFFADVF